MKKRIQKIIIALILFILGLIINVDNIWINNTLFILSYILVGYDILKSIIETDEGSHYLGEIALVPYDSPIRHMNLLFYNTLFDENASCHLAIGKGFAECLKDGLSMDKKELFDHGVNDSLTHVDFMIGTQDLKITALLEDGQEISIFENGNFVF